MLLLGGGSMLLPSLTGESVPFQEFLGQGIGLLVVGILIFSSRLSIGSDRLTNHILLFNRSVRFSDIISLRLAKQFGGGLKGTVNLVIHFEKDGKKGKRVINKINQYQDYEQFIREVEMFSNKKVEKV